MEKIKQPKLLKYNVEWRNSKIQNISTLTFHYSSPNIQQKFSYISHTLFPFFLDFHHISSDFLHISPHFFRLSPFFSDFLHRRFYRECMKVQLPNGNGDRLNFFWYISTYVKNPPVTHRMPLRAIIVFWPLSSLPLNKQ